MTEHGVPEERLKLEHVLAEIGLREEHEDERTRTANAKLTSILAVLPIVIALATSAFFELLPIAAKLGCSGKVFAAAFLLPIAIFCYAAIVAIGGLDPHKAAYSVVGMGVIRKYTGTGSYEDLLKKMIQERGDAVKLDGDINGWKFGVYRRAASAIVAGLVAIVAVAILFLIAFFFRPTAFQNGSDAGSTGSSHVPYLAASVEVS
jgi:hypothetical protein